MKKTILVMMAMFVCAISSVNAQIEAGLPVPLSLSQSISSKYLKKGDVIKFTVSSEVYDNAGDLVIPEGAIAYGTVVEKHNRKGFGKAASMDLRIDYVALPNGSRVSLRSDDILVKGKTNKLTRTLGYVGCFWLVTLPFAAVKGGHAVLDKGTAAQAYTM